MSKRVLGGLAPLLFPFASYAAPSVLSGSYYARSQGARDWSRPVAAMPLKTPTTPQVQADESGDDSLPVLMQGRPVTELVVVDASVPDKTTLLHRIRPGVAVVELDEARDSLEQLKSTLLAYRELSAIHVVSHARDGALLLGSHTLDATAVEADPSFFNAVKMALADDGDLLFYGCDLAKSEVGDAWLELVSQGTGADVAASNDLTGNEAQGGDWTLEIAKGDIEATVPFSDKAQKDFSGVLAPATYTMLGFYNANPSSYWQQSSISSGDGKLLLSSRVD